MPERFQSTPPVKAATSIAGSFNRILVFQTTPPVKAATGFAPTATAR